MDKTEAITFLVTNCSCLKGQEQALNNLPEASVLGLTEYVDALADTAGTLNDIRTQLGIGADVQNTSLAELVVNKMGGKKAGCDDDEDTDDETVTNHLVARLSDEGREKWNQFNEHQQKQRKAKLDKLVSLVPTANQKAYRTRLEAKTDADLDDMLLPLVSNTSAQADFSGAAGGGGADTLNRSNGDEPDGEPLVAPTINYAEMAYQKGKRD